MAIKAPEQFRSYTPEFLDCRDMHHPWQLDTWYRQDGEVRRVLTCPRCDTERVDRWTVNGERIGSSYAYPEGYRLEGGVATEDVRLAAMARATIYSSWDAALKASEKKRGKR